jgi:hypothetical protein
MEKKPVAAKTLFSISINAGKKLYPKKMVTRPDILTTTGIM